MSVQLQRGREKNVLARVEWLPFSRSHVTHVTLSQTDVDRHTDKCKISIMIIIADKCNVYKSVSIIILLDTRNELAILLIPFTPA